MAWIIPDAGKVPLTAAEIAKINAVANRGSLLAGVLAATVNKVRGRVAVLYALGPEGTIPDELEDACLKIASVAFLNQVPGGNLVLTEARQKAADDAEALLRDVAKGMFKVSVPVTQAPRQNAPRMETIAEGNSGESREDLSGL